MLIDKKYLKSLTFFTGLIILGIICFIYQLLNGLAVTGMREPVVWGLYVVNFTFSLGLGAGILIILAVVALRQEITNEFKLLLSVAAFISLSLAGIFILLDLGRIDRFYYIIIYAQVQSPLFWDFIALHILLGVSAVFSLAMLRQIFLKRELGESSCALEKLIHKIVTFKRELSISIVLLRKVTLGLLLTIIASYIVTTELFVSLKSRPLWNTPLLSLIFLISSITSGLSLGIILENHYLNGAKGAVKGFLSGKVKTWLAPLLVIELIIIIAKYILDTKNPLIAQTYSLFPFSLIVFVLLGNILPVLIILIPSVKNTFLCQLVPFLVLALTFLKRLELIVVAYFQRWLAFAPAASHYLPTIPETVLCLAIYAAGILAVLGVLHFTKISSYEG